MSTNLTRITWNYTDKTEFDKYSSIALKLVNEMTIYQNQYDLEQNKIITMQEFKKDLADWYTKNKSTFFLYEENDTVVGMVVTAQSIYKKSKVIWITTLVVDTSFRSKGYGTYILEDILKHLKSLGYQTVLLRVFCKNTHAYQLYKKLGFTPLDTVLERSLENMGTNTNNIYYLNIGDEVMPNHQLHDIAQEQYSITKKSYTFKQLSQLSEKQFNSLLKANFDQIGQESLPTIITSFFIKLVNLLLRIFNNFKTTIFGLFKDLKRTELRAYIESHPASIKRILKYNYTMLADIKIPIPKGMIKPYKVVSETLSTSLATFDMTNKSKSFHNKVDDIRQRVLSSSAPDAASLRDINDIQILTRVSKDVENCFSKLQPTKEVQFSQVFKDDTCLVDTYNVLLNAEKYEHEVTVVYNYLQHSVSKMQEILNFIQNGHESLTKTDLLELSASCTYLANVFDMYGYVVQTLTIVEHNFVEVLKVIQRKFSL